MVEQLNLKGVDQKSLESTKSSVSQLPEAMPMSATSTYTEQAKLACFQPGLEGFQNMWYLTVIDDDTSGVQLYPRFLPDTGNTVRTVQYEIILIKYL